MLLSESDLKAARAVVMPFGKHKGKTLGQIEDEDLLYLDWLVDQDIKSGRLRTAITQIHLANGDRIQQRIDERG